MGNTRIAHVRPLREAVATRIVALRGALYLLATRARTASSDEYVATAEQCCLMASTRSIQARMLERRCGTCVTDWAKCK